MEILRNIYYMARRFKVATALNFTGLTVALSAFYMLATQVVFNQQYNSSISDAGRVFRIEAKMNADAPWGINTNRPMLEALFEMPEVESGTIIPSWIDQVEWQLNGTSVPYPLGHLRNEGMLQPFGVDILDGKATYATDEYCLMIPASMARKFFGTEMAVGRMLWNGKDSLSVTAVYRDLPDNCFLQNMVFTGMGDENRGNFSEWSYHGYLRLLSSVDPVEFRENFLDKAKPVIYKLLTGPAFASSEYTQKSAEEKAKLAAEIERQFEDYFGMVNFRVTPLTETYFSGLSPFDRGNRTALWMLRLAAVLILIVAAINYLNFTLTQGPMRIRGVNVRRVMGAQRSNLMASLVGESVVIALGAAVLALGLLQLFATTLQQTGLLNGSVAPADHPWLCALCLLSAIVVGLAVGTYPAWYVTSFQPALALQGSFGLSSRGRRLRTALVALQVMVAFVISTYIGILWLQSHYIYTSDYGFDKDEVCYAQLTPELMPRKEAIRSELMALGGVEDVAFSNFALGSKPNYMGWGRGEGDRQITFTSMPVDWRYLRLMGIEILEGRDFQEHDGDVYIINEAARRRWSWVEMGKPLTDNDLPVVGVCSNIRYASIHQDRDSEPVAFVILGEKYAQWGDRLSIVNVRIAQGVDKREKRRQIQDRLREMGSTDSLEVVFLDQQLQRLYEEEFRFIHQILALAVLTLFITLVGVFCLTLFETEYRRKEIGIRKIMGSSRGQVLRLLVGRYLWLTLAAYAVAAPVAYVVGLHWLQNFTERATVPWWLFPLSFLCVGGAALGTVALQAWRAANANPIASIEG